MGNVNSNKRSNDSSILVITHMYILLAIVSSFIATVRALITLDTDRKYDNVT